MENLDAIAKIINDKNLQVDQNNIIEKDFDKRGRPVDMKFEIRTNKEIKYKLYRFEEKDFPFFKPVTNLKKMCDYILFAEENNHLHIFLIELKLSPMSAKKQLESAHEFATFLIKSCSRVGMVINSNSIKKIRICQKIVNKRSNLTAENSFIFDKDNFLDYNLKTFHLPTLMQY